MSDILMPKRKVAKALARFPKPNDEQYFDDLWPLTDQANNLKKDASVKQRREDIVDNAHEHIASIYQNKSVDVKGFQSVARLGAGKYVIFSDHHITYNGHRHDYFRSFGNSKLYTDLLLGYYLKGYTLIENGDVEELLVHEPDLAYSKAIGKLNLNSEGDMEKLKALRRTKRLSNLRKIMDTYQADAKSPYKAIAGSFHKSGRFVRLIGNHDLDLHDISFALMLREAFYPGLIIHDIATIAKPNSGGSKPAQPGPMSVGVNADGPMSVGVNAGSPMSVGMQAPQFIVAHGHQFDHSCHPVFAAKAGEVFSECTSWAFEGADRVWRWADEVKAWADGNSSFNNALVSAVPKSTKLDPETRLLNAATFYMPDGRLSTKNFVEHVIKPHEVTELRGFMETALGNQIAWEYLNGLDDYAKMFSILEFKEFFKFRHLNEAALRTEILKNFPTSAARPTLVLGHTHEVRSNPLSVTFSTQPPYAPVPGTFPSYLNTGAAGRFENLIWAIEVDNGVSTLVSWSYKNGPHSSEPIRRKYTGSGTASGNTLKGVISNDY